jgi:hypothetical protein
LTHGGEFGNHGLQENADSSFRWQLMTVVGQLTGWHGEICRTQIFAPCVIKRRKQSIISSHVFAREFWFLLLRRMVLAACSPHASETNFQDWWRRASNMVNKPSKKV